MKGIVHGKIGQEAVASVSQYHLTDDRWIPRKMTSNAENVSIWWRHHAVKFFTALSENKVFSY